MVHGNTIYQIKQQPLEKKWEWISSQQNPVKMFEILMNHNGNNETQNNHHTLQMIAVLCPLEKLC